MIGVLAALFVDFLDAELPNHLKFRTADRRDGIGNRNHTAEMGFVNFGDVVLNHDRIADCLRLAERLGGAAVTVPGQDVAQGVVEYAQANNFTHIVIAKSRRSRWAELSRAPRTLSSAMASTRLHPGSSRCGMNRTSTSGAALRSNLRTLNSTITRPAR